LAPSLAQPDHCHPSVPLAPSPAPSAPCPHLVCLGLFKAEAVPPCDPSVRPERFLAEAPPCPRSAPPQPLAAEWVVQLEEEAAVPEVEVVVAVTASPRSALINSFHYLD